MKSNRARIVLSVLVIFLFIFNSSFIAPAQIQFLPSQSQSNPGSNSLLRISSNGSLLNFQQDGISASNGSTMFRTDFVGNKLTIPIADTPDEESRHTPAMTGKITYANLWPGITLVYDAPEGSVIRSTYQIQPHADPDSIRLAYTHPVSIMADGQLAIEADGAVLRESAPLAWQVVYGKTRAVPVAFKLIADPENGRPLVGFELGDYDPNLPLTIDPTLVWNAFYSSSFSRVMDAAIDPTGQYIYAVGYSTSTWGTPLNPYQGGWDITVAKFDTGMNLLWNTFLGSASTEMANSVDVDSNGDIYIAGYGNANWGTPANPYSGTSNNAIISVLNSDGEYQWHTFLGGTGSTTTGSTIAVSSNAIFIAGLETAASWGSPISPFISAANKNGFIARVNKTTHALNWNTFFGGLNSDVHTYDGISTIEGMGLDNLENVYIGGRSGAYSFTGLGSPIRARTLDSLFDDYIAKWNASGAFQWYTFLGGAGNENTRGFAVDTNGNSYSTGQSSVTWGSPLSAWSSDCQWYLARVNSSGTLVWNTFLNNTSVGNFHLIKLDPGGNIYLIGEYSQTWGSPDPNLPYTGSRDGQIIVLNSSGALQWHGFLGGAGSDTVDTLSVYDADSIYIFGTSTQAWGGTSTLSPWSSTNQKFIARVGLENRAPTDISLSNNSIPENEPANTSIGSFATTDPDTGNMFTYTLVSGTGDTDNGSFNISGSALHASTSFDYETKTSYTIRVRSTDQSGLYTEKPFTVSITDVNDNAAPTNITLSASSVAENSSVNTTIGSFTTTDPDSGNTFTYTLVSGTGSTDNASFNISGSSLRNAAVFDYETKSSYSIRVRTTDQGGLYYEKAFTISITNVNETPTNIALSGSSIEENRVVNTTIGSFTTTDPDTGNTFTYALVSGTGGTDNASFNISGSSLRTSAAFDYETKSSYSIRVRTTDQGGLYYEKAFTITVTNKTELTINAPASLTYGNTNTLTTSGGSGTGAVTFSAGTSTGCSVTGSTLSVTNASGTCSVSAAKAGDGTYVAETTAAASVMLNKADQAALTVNTPASLTYGSTSTLTISGGSGTGAVTFSTGASTGCSISGSTLSVTNASGTCSVSAAKAGDNNYNDAASLAVSVTLNKATPTINVISISPSPSVTGQLYTITFSVSHAAGTPTGDVTVDDGSDTTAGRCTGALSGGSGSCSIVSTAAGFDTLTLNYGGDSQFSTADKTNSHTVTKASSSVTIISDSADPSLTGQPYTVNVTVNAVSPGSGTPGGNVSVSDGEGGACTITLSDGSGTCDITTDTTGTKTISAAYNGDDDFISSSDTETHEVGLASSETTIISDDPDPSAAGENVEFVAQVAAIAPSLGTPDGTVEFREGDATLCSATLAEGLASCTYNGFESGVHSIEAVYLGVSNTYTTSISAITSHTVQSISLDDNKTSTSFINVGNFSTGGNEMGPYSYALQSAGRICNAANSSGNDKFLISNSVLQRKTDTPAGTYSICVESTDSIGGKVQGVFSIIINNPPSSENLSLDHQTVSVTQTDVGTFSSDAGQEPLVFSLAITGEVCTAEKSAGNRYFSITGNGLKRISSTATGEYSICAQVTDAENQVTQKAFTITVTAAPSELSLSRKTVSTDQTDVGDFGITNGQSPFTFSLQTSGEDCTTGNGQDNGAFEIDGSTLQRLRATGNGTYTICAQATDANGLTTQAAFTIIVTAPPSDITLSNSDVSTSQVIVGTLATIDGQSRFTYSLETSGEICDAANSAGNVFFTIKGNALERKESTPEGGYSVCIQTTDANEESYQKAFEILVTHDESGPVDWEIHLSNDRVIDGDTAGTLVGSMTAANADGSLDGVTYALADTDAFPLAENFNISSSGKLTLAATVHYDENRYYPIRILASAEDGTTRYLDAVIVVMKNGTLNGASAVDDISRVVTTGQVTIDVLANDTFSNDASGWELHRIVKYPDHGEAEIGSIIYTPDDFWTGVDSLTYEACDDEDYCVRGRVTITVLPVPFAPATGFAPGAATPLAKQPQTKQYQSLGDLVLEIPSLSIQADIVWVPTTDQGWDITWLGNDVGLLNGTAFPTWNGNSVLTGHLYDSYGNPGIFNQLNKLAWGDQIIIHLDGQKYFYEVREVLPKVDPNSLQEIILHKDTPWITLITCQGYEEETNSYLWRYLVRSALVRIE